MHLEIPGVRWSSGEWAGMIKGALKTVICSEDHALIWKIRMEWAHVEARLIDLTRALLRDFREIEGNSSIGHFLFLMQSDW